MIPIALQTGLASVIGEVREASSVGGGCISNATRIRTDKGTWFLKYADGEAGQTFEAEAAGLRALRAAAQNTGVCVPEVLHAQNANGGTGLLLMEWIEPGLADSNYWERFGRALARLHKQRAPASGDAGPFGFTTDNFIGRLPQQNTWHADWVSFFREERLEPQFERARRSGHWQREWNPLSERLLSRLGELLPANPHPALLHGDLWSGNALPDAQARPWIVDPAAYVGDAEVDLAMTELFGGFGPGLYDAYRSESPVSARYEERRDLYNLYHLLNHLNHFGASYAGSVGRLLERFGR